MTVKELIERLQALDHHDEPIYVMDEHMELCDSLEVTAGYTIKDGMKHLTYQIEIL